MGKGLDIIKKMLGNRTEDRGYEKISADEMELRSYQREEQRDELRKVLAHYRLKKNREIILGNTFVDQAREIHGNRGFLEADNVFNKQENMFNHPSTILNAGGCKKVKTKRRYRRWV